MKRQSAAVLYSGLLSVVCADATWSSSWRPAGGLVGGFGVRQSVEQSAGVDQAFTDTSDSVRRINDMTAQIATACEQRSSVTEEIARTISDIRDLSNEAAQTSVQSAQAGQRLSELSNDLSSLVAVFAFSLFRRAKYLKRL